MTSARFAQAYGAEGLAGVLPAVAVALGVPTDGRDAHLLELPPARRAVVVLVDGMGYDLLTARAGHAPYLRSLLPAGRRLTCGFPSTTATSLGTFGTGLPPGAHGLVGFEVLDPATDRLLNELSWQDGPIPETWQPHRTVFERAEADGVGVTRIGPGFFDGSGLTRAALRGGRFLAANPLAERVALAAEAVRRTARHLVYLYWGDLDKVGHEHGCASWQWLEELEAVDAALRQLAERVPADTAVYVTADHGMVDCPFETRIDLAMTPELNAGVRHAGGEARARQLYCQPGAKADVRDAWAQLLGERAAVVDREDAIAAGWFGPVDARVRDRIGDMLVVMTGDLAVVDSRRDRPPLLALLGHHGSVTPVEVAVPLLCCPAAEAAVAL